MKSLILIAVTLGACFAQAIVCFHDKESYDVVRAKLPALIQTGELTLIHKSKSLLAAFRFFGAGKNFKIESHVWHSWLGLEQSEDVVKEICIKKDTANVVMKDGSKQKLAFDTQAKEVTIQNYEFKPASNKDFHGIVDLIAEKAQD
jgi:hypothetical protein